jgi:HD-GYP domain-containing protein (c-di-GMP phosphodiesterase class II)
MMEAPMSDTLSSIIQIGIAISAEKDLDRLLTLILEKSMDLSCSDAGSIYLVQKGGLGFKVAITRSLRLDQRFTDIVLPITSSSIAGHVALTGTPLLIDDCYDLPPGAPYTFNRSFDQGHGYRTKSQLVIPMKNHHEEVIGVLQLINRKSAEDAVLAGPSDTERHVLPYDEEHARLMTALASLAAVSIENNQLYQSIRRLFEGFVDASVKAIEQRDPTTSGHSQRVSMLTCGLAEAVDRLPEGRFAPVRFDEASMREMKYAGLLHDFGKVGVREEVLVKSKKLYPYDLERIWWRVQYQKRTVQFQALQRKLRIRGDQETAAIDAWEAEELAKLDAAYATILRANEPTVLPEGDFRFLQEFSRLPFDHPDGGRVPFLLDDEVKVLSIRKGSLDDRERLEIESHVTHTFEFLSKIPWTADLQDIPDIAFAHHEKLNGRGYPRGLTDPEIPLQSKMMAVADIFDALSASDRPYKRAVPVDKALDILTMEARDHQLDADLVSVFIEAKIWEQTLHMRRTRA